MPDTALTDRALPDAAAATLQVLKDMEKFWQKQFDQNYSRSLDHRSFYFKSIDKKVLGNRHIMGELREASESNCSRPEAALTVHAAVPEAVRLRPDLVLDMPCQCAPRPAMPSQTLHNSGAGLSGARRTVASRCSSVVQESAAWVLSTTRSVPALCNTATSSASWSL